MKLIEDEEFENDLENDKLEAALQISERSLKMNNFAEGKFRSNYT